MGTLAEISPKTSRLRRLLNQNTTMKIIATYSRTCWARSINGIKKPLAGALQVLPALSAISLLAGCAGLGSEATQPHYRCEHDIEFSVKFADDSALLNGSRGSDVLYRDAGGQGDKQTVYSNPRMRAEFGMGASGLEAILRYPLLPLVARCVRE